MTLAGWALLVAAGWALVLGWLLSPWLELAAAVGWTIALLYVLEREGRRR